MPTPKWHTIFTQHKCPDSQMFFGSAERLDIAAVEGTFLRDSAWPDGAPRSPGIGRVWAPEHACLQAWHRLGCSGQSQISTPGASAPTLPGLPSTALLAAGKL